MVVGNDRARQAARSRLTLSAGAAQARATRDEAPALLARWVELDVTTRRRVVEALCAKVKIMPATVRGRPYYDQARLRVTPR
jgi:hypothetical protein